MNHLAFSRTYIVLSFSLLVFGCGGGEEEAKKLGFSNLAEMETIHAQGWHTKERYNEDSAKANGFASYADMSAAAESKRKEEERRLESARQVAEAERKRIEAFAVERASAVKACDWNIKEELNSFASHKGRLGKALAAEVGFNISWEKGQNGFDVEEEALLKAPKKIVAIGKYKFNEKQLPVCVEEITIPFINRSKGERKSSCYRIGYANDNEFSMYRAVVTSECAEASKKFIDWQTTHNIIDLK